jgi:hypothetical protein
MIQFVDGDEMELATENGDGKLRMENQEETIRGLTHQS